MIQLLVILSSMANNKFYIPGETKEVEVVRKKAIINGVIVLADIIVKITENQEIISKLKNEVLDIQDINDKKLNTYTVFAHYK